MNFNGLFWQQPISNGREWIFTRNPEAFRIVRSCIRRGGFQAGALTKAHPRPTFEDSENLTWILFSAW